MFPPFALNFGNVSNETIQSYRVYRVLPGFTEFCRVLIGFTGFYRVLPGFTGF